MSFVANNQAGAAQLFLERLVQRYPKEYALDTVRLYLDRVTAGPAPPVWGVGMARVATDALSKIADLRTAFPTSEPRFLDLTVPVVLVDTPALVSRAHDALRDPAVGVVGVDREARPCFVARAEELGSDAPSESPTREGRHISDLIHTLVICSGQGREWRPINSSP